MKDTWDFSSEYFEVYLKNFNLASIFSLNFNLQFRLQFFVKRGFLFVDFCEYVLGLIN